MEKTIVKSRVRKAAPVNADKVKSRVRKAAPVNADKVKSIEKATTLPETILIKKNIPVGSSINSYDYIAAVGRRKSAVARVRLFKQDGEIIVNTLPLAKYFPTFDLQLMVRSALKIVGAIDLAVKIKVQGGGKIAQAVAVRHGLARALVKYNPEFRLALRTAGFLTRDARIKERKKPGLKKARRAPQFSKR